MNQSELRVIKWSVILALGGFLFGFDTAVISGVEKTIQRVFDLSVFWHGFAIASALIGTVIGALVTGYPADRYGRKPVLFVIAFLFAASSFGSAVAGDVSTFIIFRFLGGIAVGGSSVVAPMYISEISPARLRGRMTALFQFNVIFGILIAYVSNYLLADMGDDAWRWMLGIGGVPAVAYFFLLLLVPESPRFLIKSGHIDTARQVLERILPGSAEEELRQIQRGMLEKKGKLFSGRFTKPIIIAFLVAMFNQLSGINAILYFAPRIFELSGIPAASSLLQPVFIGITNGIFTLLGLFIIDRVGRKKLLITGSIGMSVFLGLVARSFYLQDFAGYELLAFLIGYIVCFAFSTGAVVWVLIAEIFPTSVRGQGQSLGSFSHWFFAAVITFLFPIVASQSDHGAGHMFLFFSLSMVLQALVVWKYFPETKQKTLEQLAEELSPEKTSHTSRSSHAPINH